MGKCIVLEQAVGQLQAAKHTYKLECQEVDEWDIENLKNSQNFSKSDETINPQIQ